MQSCSTMIFTFKASADYSAQKAGFMEERQCAQVDGERYYKRQMVQNMELCEATVALTSKEWRLSRWAGDLMFHYQGRLQKAAGSL